MRAWLTWQRMALALLALIILALLAVWIERESIARRFADAELEARQVAARYELTQVGPRTQRIENVVIGDPRDPDLVARWAEIELVGGLSGVRIRAIRARGVRLKARLANGRLSFGAVDRLLPAPSDAPFTLPDIAIDLGDTEVRLDTPYGPVGAGISGRGNIAKNFGGVIALDMPRFAMPGIEARALTAHQRVTTAARRIRFEGPIRAGAARSSGIDLRGMNAFVSGESDERFSRPELRADANADILRLPGLQGGLARVEARLTGDGVDTYRASGRLDLARTRPDDRARAALAAPFNIGSGTPVEPLVRQLRMAIGALDRGLSANVDFAASWRVNGPRVVRVTPSIRSASGATLVSNGDGFGWDFRVNRLTGGDRLALSGGGFPTAQVQLRTTPQGLSGRAIVQPFAAGGARLALTPMAFATTPAGLRLETVALLDGPIGDGRITGLRLPVTLRPGVAPLTGCFTPSFQRLSIAGLVLSPTALRTCVQNNEARIAAPVLRGRLGQSPIGIAAADARVEFGNGGFSVRTLAVRLGTTERQTRFNAGQLSGRFARGGASGQFSGASGQIGNVPLLISDASGRWALANGVLSVNGGLRLADAAADPRFFPLVSDDFALRLAGGLITATATAREPRGNARIADVRVEHRLSTGSGQAVIDVRGLAFDERLQPDTLTPITLGVVANVRGEVDGTGIIRWTPQGVTSSGGFRTESLDLAAAFGPVTGLSGEIELADLLNLQTARPQTIRIGSLNPGIAVLEGELTYRLLPNRQAAIDGGRWPFAGGVLILEPTVIDLGTTSERRLTFRVEGVDAAKFVQDMQFENIAVTGIFDGVVPLIFDKDGGRIVGGELTARGPGALSYIGEVSNENLGLMGSFAFDALKAMKYSRLAIGLDGPLDGDVVTRIGLQGVTQAPVGTPRRRLPITVRGLDNFPLKFNITITAPFRRLFRMARTISDPSLLLEDLNPRLERVGPATTLPKADVPVQPPESRR